MFDVEAVLFEERDEFLEVDIGVILHDYVFDLLEICLGGVEEYVFFGSFDVEFEKVYFLYFVFFEDL